MQLVANLPTDWRSNAVVVRITAKVHARFSDGELFEELELSALLVDGTVRAEFVSVGAVATTAAM